MSTNKCKKAQNGIKHTTSPPYHPASNGLAERAVQIFKRGVWKMKDRNLQTKLARFLFNYRITPQSTTGTSPAELLQGWILRSALDLLKPDLNRRIERHQEKQKETHDKHAVPRTFHTGDLVYAQNFGSGNTWLPARVVEVMGPWQYQVELLHSERVWRCHVDQLRKCHVNEEDLGTSSTELDCDWDLLGTASAPVCDSSDSPASREGLASSPGLNIEPAVTSESSRRYPERNRQPPDRLVTSII